MQSLSVNSPIGNVQNAAEVNVYVNALAKEWDANKTEKKTWFLWWETKKTSIVEVTNFLLSSLDELIKFVDDLIDDGADKKATVLAAIGALYDYIAINALPLWLRPLSTPIKNIILGVIISSSIDFIVDKYKNGIWNKTKEEENNEETTIV